ncbi:DnaJ subfamily B member 5 [Exophiala xenobiotica]|uniref:DnaJ subfamily B member 5 n=1 Tax=Lithohypha guttulata TaxID=1690604 RepID=A0ABR0KMG2_9EURO|nr:DnaJ subfamily B member 5 [Lithohypha guttulata]KAK5325427.1 DnaJ subfamily B member 5 [Exophiala xenobiotica]
MASFAKDAIPCDPFTILGIPHASSKAAVKKAFNDLALIYHPDKAGQQATARFQEILGAYHAIRSGKLCSDSPFGDEENADEPCFESTDRAIWEGPPIPSGLSEKDKFNLLKGRLKRFFESKRGKLLGGNDQNTTHVSFEAQIGTQIDIVDALTHTMSNELSAAVGQLLHLLKRMWMDYTMGVRSELIASFQCETMASATGVLGLLPPRTMRFVSDQFIVVERAWIRAAPGSVPQSQGWLRIEGTVERPMRAMIWTSQRSDEDVEMTDV